MKPILHRATHHIRRGLEQHLSTAHLKVVSFCIALFLCLSLGSIMLFSLYATSLHHSLGWLYLQINFIASFSAFGMYLCLPVLGYLADSHGPALLSLISIWFFCPSYFVNTLVVRAENPLELHLYVLGVSFCFIGLATSSLYFLSLITCAKIYPHRKGLAISLPVSCYGLSTLMGSQLMKLAYFQSDHGLDLSRVFTFFLILYLVVGVLNFVSNSIVLMELDVIFEHNETTPLLEDDEGLIPVRSAVEPVNHKSRYKQFLGDKSMWLLMVSLILNIGPLESFQNNLGLIIDNVPGHTELANQVSVVAAFSTVTRLVFGAGSDYVSSPNRKYPVCRIWLLVAAILLGTVGQFLANKSQTFGVVLVLNGASYGGLFTVYPTIIALVWGIDIMGLTWGTFMVAPAVGSIVYSLIYGKLVDLRCQGATPGTCLNGYFAITGTSLFVSMAVVLIVWRFMWVQRGLTTF